VIIAPKLSHEIKNPKKIRKTIRGELSMFLKKR